MIFLPGGASFPPGATHLWLLIRAVLRTEGPILEYGAGMYSTPVLAELAKGLGREFVSVEQNDQWAKFARQFGHEVMEGNYAKTQGPSHERFAHAGVVFVDHDTGYRMAEVMYWKDHADVVILHDAEAEEKYKDFPNVVLDGRMEPKTMLCSPASTEWAA